MNKILKGSIAIFTRLVHLYKQNIPHVVFLFILLFLFIFIRQLPYINIIPQYYYYVVLIYIFLILFFFRKQISSSILFTLITIIIVVAFIADLFSITNVAIFLGFIIFVFTFLGAFVDFFINRKNLREF